MRAMLGDLPQSQTAFLPQRQSTACPLAHPILGRKWGGGEGIKQGGIGKHSSEWDIMDNESGNGFSFFLRFSCIVR